MISFIPSGRQMKMHLNPENLNVLQEQVLEIEKQNTMMENKDQTIETQRG